MLVVFSSSSSSSFRLEDYIQRVIRRLFTFFSRRLCFERKSTRREKKTRSRSSLSLFVSSTSLAALHRTPRLRARALHRTHVQIARRVFFRMPPLKRVFGGGQRNNNNNIIFYSTSDDDDDDDDDDDNDDDDDDFLVIFS